MIMLKRVMVIFGISLLLSFSASCIQVAQHREWAQMQKVEGVVIKHDEGLAAINVEYIDLNQFNERIAVAQKHKIKNIKLVVYSGGGSLLDMFAIIDRIRILKSKGYHFTSHINGLAASAAVPIFLQGEYRTMGQYANIMIHPHSLWGKSIKDYTWKETAETDPTELTLFKKMSEVWTTQYVNLMVDGSNLSFEEAWKYATTINSERGQYWFTAEESLQMGFIHEII
jgi:ATP-dependent protease ClpP protease subunit